MQTYKTRTKDFQLSTRRRIAFKLWSGKYDITKQILKKAMGRIIQPPSSFIPCRPITWTAYQHWWFTYAQPPPSRSVPSCAKFLAWRFMVKTYNNWKTLTLSAKTRWTYTFRGARRVGLREIFWATKKINILEKAFFESQVPRVV